MFPVLIVVYFAYGLAFFSMGLLVAAEGGRSSDDRLRKALRPLAAFGLVHGIHEWLEMFQQISALRGDHVPLFFEAVGLALLSFSFLSLAAFGTFLLSKTETAQRVSLLVPLGLEAVWVFGILIFRGVYAPEQMWVVASAWTRYVLAVPASLLAAVGLVAQQRAFRQAGLVRFGQDSLWAAVAFAWYGLVGQVFIRASVLPPSNVINQELFLRVFGFPVQAFRAVMACAVAVFVVRFLRAFQVELEEHIAELQSARLEEARRREALHSELYSRVVAAQESERQRIARDLHDATGQSLTAIGLGLRGLSTGLGKKGNSAHSAETLGKLQTMSAEALKELQDLISDLRPSHLDDLGLPAAIRWYAGTIQERTGLKVKVETACEERPVSPAAKITTFRIVQEALNNVIKHSGAHTVLINMDCGGEALYVSVRDDGQGFDPQANVQPAARRPLGLLGMQERAALLGGTVSVHSRPGQGTLVELTIPYGEKEVADADPPAAGG
jgi:signal transduction histidine kinase